MIKKTRTGIKYETVGSGRNTIILIAGKIIGFLRHNPKARIQARTTGEWMHGPRWEIFTKDNRQLVFIPDSMDRAVKFLADYSKGHYHEEEYLV